MLTQGPIRAEALADRDLLTQVVRHKETFYPSAWARSDLARPGSFRLARVENRVAEGVQKSRRPGLGLGTTRRRPSPRFFPVSTYLSSSRSGVRCLNRLNPLSDLSTNRIPHRRRSGHPCHSIRQLEHPDLGTLRFLCSFARPAPTIGIYNPLHTNDGELAMSSRIIRARTVDLDRKF